MSEKTSTILRRLLTGWLWAAFVEYIFLPIRLRSLESLEGLAQKSLPSVVLGTILTAVLLSAWNKPKGERWLLFGAWTLYGGAALVWNFRLSFLGGNLLVWGILLNYACQGWAGESLHPRKNRDRDKRCAAAAVGLALAFFLFVGAWGLCRIWNFNTPSYDFGIFAQMFHSMKETGLPMTTLERDGALSHFAVHVSPIYYLMLPLYCLFPCPENLQLQQAAVMASAVIPLWKLAKRHGLTPIQRTLLCGILLFFPAYAGGAGYDLHENCFLTPCILWLFYGIDRKWGLVTAAAALLTMMVKEDAPVYTAAIGFWLLVRGALREEKWSRRAGAVLLAASVTWFFCATAYLAHFGDGVMSGRYQNFLYDGSDSLLTVIKAVILCPVKALYECTDPEKLEFLSLTILPLLALPLMTRSYENYILLIPYILVNLMSDYRYQHDLFFQYTFGSVACLMYLTLRHLPHRGRTGVLVCALLVCLGCFCHRTVPKAMTYPVRCVENWDRNQSIRETLAIIPPDATVSASTFYTVPLSNREILYDLTHSSLEHILSTEYIVLAEGDKAVAELLELEFRIVAQLPTILTIYQKAPAP